MDEKSQKILTGSTYDCVTESINISFYYNR